MKGEPYTYLSRRGDGLCAVIFGGSMACNYIGRSEAEAVYKRAKRKDDPDKPWVWCHVAAEKAFTEGKGGDGCHGWVEFA